MAQASAGWYPDPSGAPGQRYFDGTRWTQWTHHASPAVAPQVPAKLDGEMGVDFGAKKADELTDLFRVARDHRDDAWIQQFYEAVPGAALMSFSPQVEKGPDLFPYFQLAVLCRGPEVSLANVLDHLLDIGCGAAIFGDPDRSNPPDWIFSYGDLLCYRLYGRFDGTPRAAGGSPGASTGGPTVTRLEHDETVLVAAPSESYLPQKARRAIGRYMREVYRHPDPRVALVELPSLDPPRNLMVNLTLAQYQGDSGKLNAAVGRLLWFLPKTYSLMPMPEGFKSSVFVSLQ
jgi:hypothetical protein